MGYKFQRSTLLNCMHLELTENFARSEDVEFFHSELGKYFVIGKPKLLFRRSLGDLLQYLVLIGAAAEWLGLRNAVKVYFATLAKHAGDATWNKLASLKQSEEALPLVDVASTLTTAIQNVDGKAIIIIGINTPDDIHGTILSIQSTNVEGVIHELASYIVHVEELSAAMQKEIEAGREPLGSAIVKLQDDGSLLVKWTGRNDSKEHVLRIP